MSDRLQREIEAQQAWTDLLKSALHVAALHRGAGVAIPARLAAMLGDDDDDEKVGSGLNIQAPPLPPAPLAAPLSAICVPAAECTPVTLSLAILRQSSDPLSPIDIAKRAEQLRGGEAGLVNRNSYYNALSRLFNAECWVGKNESGEYFAVGDKYLWIEGGYVWGEPAAFQDQERSHFRRYMIQHILRQVPDGLMAAQLVTQLRVMMSRWKDIPVSKDVVKADLDYLRGHDVAKQIGNSRKWTIKT